MIAALTTASSAAYVLPARASMTPSRAAVSMEAPVYSTATGLEVASCQTEFVKERRYYDIEKILLSFVDEDGYTGDGCDAFASYEKK